MTRKLIEFVKAAGKLMADHPWMSKLVVLYFAYVASDKVLEYVNSLDETKY